MTLTWLRVALAFYGVGLLYAMFALTRASAEYVSCFGSGTIRPELAKKYNSPFAVETAHIKLKDSDLTARIIRSLFDTARQYRESFDAPSPSSKPSAKAATPRHAYTSVLKRIAWSGRSRFAWIA